MNEKKIKKIEQSIEKLQQELESLKKPKFESSKWYKAENALACYQGGSKGYGFTFSRWDEESTWSFNSFPQSWTPATNEEVEAALIKEAKKRGFKEGVRFNSLDQSDSRTKGVKNVKASNKFGLTSLKRLHCNGYTCFYKGKWSEIIEEPKVVINGYEMKQDGDIISFGCAKFHKEFFYRIETTINYVNGGTDDSCIAHRGIQCDNNRKIKSITLDSGVEITVKQLKEIVDNLK